MREVTNLMINEYGLKKLKMDMMGYKVVRSEDYSFHHLLIAHRDCKKLRVPCDGYTVENGAILSSKSAHPYFHVIEHYDEDLFYLITSEIVDMKVKGCVDRENLLRIHSLLEDFEERFGKEYTKKGKMIIKKEFLDRVDLYNPVVCEKLEEVKKKVLTKRK